MFVGLLPLPASIQELMLLYVTASVTLGYMPFYTVV